ncbi:MAG: GNAT family N-acetyltransferase [Pseudomonadota bacterium]
MSRLTIRLAEAADVPRVEACARAAYAPYVSRIGREPAPMVADFDTAVGARQVHVAGVGTEPFLGYIVFFPSGSHMALGNVAVFPEATGRGIGKALISHCEHCARQAGLRAVQLYTNAKMTENLGLYPALGYREIDRRVEDGFDRVFFEKTLP